MIGTAAWFVRKNRERFDTWAAGMLVMWLAFQMGNLVFWEHHMLSLVPLCALLLSRDWEHRRKFFLVFAAAFFAVFNIPRLIDMSPLFGFKGKRSEMYMLHGKYGVTTLVMLAIWCALLYLVVKFGKQDTTADQAPDPDGHATPAATEAGET
jgi:hypothetical protein